MAKANTRLPIMVCILHTIVEITTGNLTVCPSVKPTHTHTFRCMYYIFMGPLFLTYFLV